MLFINLEEFSASFHIYGDAVRATYPNPFRSGSRLCEDYCVRYQAFNQLHRDQGKSFETAELLGFKLRGYLSVNDGVLTHRRNLGGLNTAGLLIYHQNLNTTLSFEDWLKLLPGVLGSRNHERSNLSIMSTDDGQWVLFFIQHGQIQHQVLTERCFIKGGEVVTLAQMIENRRNQIVEQEGRLNKLVERFNTHSFQISEELQDSELLNNCVFNPSRP